MVETTSSSTGKTSVDAFLKQMQKKYTKDPYEINGEKDTLLRRVSSAIGNDTKAAALKRRRVSEVRALKDFESSIPDESQRKIASAPKEIEFLKQAAEALKKSLRTGSDNKSAASTVATAFNTLAKELRDLVQSYEDARGVTGIRPDTNTQDAAFVKSAASVLKTLEKTAYSVQAKLRSEKKYFNTSAASAERTVKAIKSTLDALPAAPSSIDIIV